MQEKKSFVRKCGGGEVLDDILSLLLLDIFIYISINSCLNILYVYYMDEKSILIFSLPRSWSTYLSSELVVRTGKQLLYENLRRFFRKEFEHPLHASRYLGNARIKDVLQEVPHADKIKYENFLDTITTHPTIIKETDAIFHIEHLQEVLHDQIFVGLTRSLFWALNAHLKIHDVWNRWKYEWRTNATYTSLKDTVNDSIQIDYLESYARANGKSFNGVDWIPMLCVHLWVQLTELKRLCKNDFLYEVKYEQLLDDVVKENYLFNILQHSWISDTWYRRALTKKLQNKWVHTTKHTSINPLQRIDNFTYSDVKFFESLFSDQMLQTLDLGYEKLRFKNQSIVVPNFHWNYWTIKDIKQARKPLEDEETNVKSTFVTNESLWETISISNTLITNNQFVAFLNYYLWKGFKEIHKIIHSDVSTKEIYFDKEDCVYKVNPDAWCCPVVNVSLIASALYCIHHNKKLPSRDLYKAIHETSTHLFNGNYWEKHPTTSPVWIYKDQGWLYDLYGNVKEMCLEQNRYWWFDAYTYWWGYKSESPLIVNGILNIIPLFVCESDVWFRMCDTWIIDNNRSVDDISWYLSQILGTNNEEKLSLIYNKILQEAIFMI